MSVRQGEHEVPLWICDELVVETQRLWMKKCLGTFEKDDYIEAQVIDPKDELDGQEI